MTPGTRAWELIVKYSGTLEAAREIAVSVTELMNGVCRCRYPGRNALGNWRGLTEIEFIEKPQEPVFLRLRREGRHHVSMLCSSRLIL